MKITSSGDSEQALQKMLDSVKFEVLVGIPSSANTRTDGEIGNSEIGYINETGSPARNIPARPHLAVGVQSVSKKWVPKLEQALKESLSGDDNKAMASFEQAGQIAADGVRNYIRTANLAPLALSTLQARARRGRMGAITEISRRLDGGDVNATNSQGQLISNTNAKPLIDTGEYLRSITYVVKKKGKQNAKS